jgi:hypothetical protein
MRANVVLPPWFRPGNNEDTLRVSQMKFVADNQSLFLAEVPRHCEVKCILGPYLLGSSRKLRKAQRQARASKIADVREIGNMKLDLPVETRQCVVDERRQKKKREATCASMWFMPSERGTFSG